MCEITRDYIFISDCRKSSELSELQFELQRLFSNSGEDRFKIISIHQGYVNLLGVSTNWESGSLEGFMSCSTHSGYGVIEISDNKLKFYLVEDGNIIPVKTSSNITGDELYNMFYKELDSYTDDSICDGTFISKLICCIERRFGCSIHIRNVHNLLLEYHFSAYVYTRDGVR